MSGGRVVLVTGAAGNIGSVLAAHLAAAGWRVLASDLDGPQLERVGRLDGVQTLPANLADAAVPEQLIASAIERGGRLDALVNNAAVLGAGGLLASDLELYERTMAVNVRAPFLLIRAALPQMLAQGGGSIVNVASVLGMIVTPEQAVYGVSKGALLQLTRQVAVEHAADGIRCNAVCPGTIVGEQQQAQMDADPTLAASLDGWLERHPAGRFGRPADIAGAVGFLLSCDAAFMHGAAVVVDGGLTLQ